MHESEPDNKWIEEKLSLDDIKEIVNAPTEQEMVVVSLLMRIYDIQLALLNHFDGEKADEIFETHAKGGNFNPDIFIPKMDD